jgi:hypothetical protein
MLSAGRFASAPAFAVVRRDALGVIARANDERASQPPRRYETRHLGVPVRTFYGSEAGSESPSALPQRRDDLDYGSPRKEAVLHAAPLGVGDREEYARLVGFFDDAGGRSYRQNIVPLDLVYHLHRFSAPSVRYPLHSRRFHAVSLAIGQLAPSLPSEPIRAIVRRCARPGE